MSKHRRVILKERPRYNFPTRNCFAVEKKAIPEPAENELLIRTLYLSLDPYLGARIKRISKQAEPVPLGEVMVGPTVGVVEQSNHPAHKVGDLVAGFWGWQEYAVSNGSRLEPVRSEVERANPSYALGAMSRVTGLGAYVGIEEVAQPFAGETVVVGTATGGLGQIAAQLAKLRGARVVGIAGGRDKCAAAVREIGLDACVSYKSKKFAEELADACPQGIDVYCETIGGNDLPAVIPLLNLNARMPVFGLMAMYGATQLPKGPDRTMLFLHQVIIKRLQVTGIVSNDYYQSHFTRFQQEMGQWIANGDIKIIEDRVDGLENAAQAFQDMFSGARKSIGKLVVKVADL